MIINFCYLFALTTVVKFEQLSKTFDAKVLVYQTSFKYPSKDGVENNLVIRKK